MYYELKSRVKFWKNKGEVLEIFSLLMVSPPFLPKIFFLLLVECVTKILGHGLLYNNGVESYKCCRIDIILE